MIQILENLQKTHLIPLDLFVCTKQNAYLCYIKQKQTISSMESLNDTAKIHHSLRSSRVFELIIVIDSTI